MPSYVRALGVTVALGAFVIILDSLGPPAWLKLVALAAAVAVTWRYWWIVNRRRLRWAVARRREEWRQRKRDRP
jgi:Flp pilus assembly protein TadB